MRKSIILFLVFYSIISKPFAQISEPVGYLELGSGWAGNTINTVIFRHNGILTFGDYQFATFFDSKEHIKIIKRNLVTSQIEESIVSGEYNVRNAHNSISLGIDKDGHLHISYNQHGNNLNYRRSINPVDIHNWSNPSPMTGEMEGRITYPTFLNSPMDTALIFLYRYGGARRGKACLKLYEVREQKWVDLPGCIFSGFDQSPWTSNPYWNHPSFDNTGRLHISYVWRNMFVDGIINNLGIDYSYSDDNGQTWFSTKGYQLRTPITQVNSERVWAVLAGANLMNQTSMATDNNGRPHIVYYANDDLGVPQYQHLWYDGDVWKNNIISKRISGFQLKGGGTLRIPMSRPEVVICNNDIVYVIFRGDLTDDRMAIQALYPPDYNYEESNLRILWDEPLGFSEPIIDRMRWQQQGVLSMLIQWNHQPDGDNMSDTFYSSVKIIDWDLSSVFGE